MNTDRVILTRAGATKLRTELQQLTNVERPKVIQAIAEARAHGDLSENAEYDAAKEQQRFIEGRISELQASLSVAEVIDPANLNANGKVVFGATITMYDTDQDSEVSYQLVGNLEAQPDAGQISISSPIGRALIGKAQGDEVVVETPAGKRVYEILSVEYE